MSVVTADAYVAANLTGSCRRQDDGCGVTRSCLRQNDSDAVRSSIDASPFRSVIGPDRRRWQR